MTMGESIYDRLSNEKSIETDCEPAGFKLSDLGN